MFRWFSGRTQWIRVQFDLLTGVGVSLIHAVHSHCTFVSFQPRVVVSPTPTWFEVRTLLWVLYAVVTCNLPRWGDINILSDELHFFFKNYKNLKNTPVLGCVFRKQLSKLNSFLIPCHNTKNPVISTNFPSQLNRSSNYSAWKFDLFYSPGPQGGHLGAWNPCFLCNTLP